MSIRKLSPELTQIAKEQLNEDPDRIEQYLKVLKDWLTKQHHLNARTDDQWLLTFLRGCKYSLERTKEKFDMYYTVRTASPDISISLDPTKSIVREYLDTGSVVIVPKVAKAGDARVLILRSGKDDPDRFSIYDALKIQTMIVTILMFKDDHIAVSGAKVITDLDGTSFAHFTQITPSIAKKLIVLSQEGSPLRSKGAHILNIPSGAETVFALFKQFMNEKNRKRWFVHNKDMEGLYKHVPKSILPTEYGGDGGPIQDMIDYTKNLIMSNREFYLEEVNFKSDESKRVGKPMTAESLYGIEGSFRQLSVD